MNSPHATPARGPSWLIGLTLILAACGGGGLSGVYTPKGGTGFFEKLSFASKNTVQITFMSQTRELAYQVSGKQLKIISPNASETQILAIDAAGCLDGGALLGVYCRDGAAATTSATGSDITGTWEAKAPGGTFRLAFSEGNKVTMTMQDDGGSPESHEGSYSLSGNQVTISAPGGVPLTFTRKGNALEGAFGGLTMTFTR